MAGFRTHSARVTMLICFGALLAACGHADPDGRKVRAAAAAPEGAASGSTSRANADAASEDDSADAEDDDRDNSDSASNAQLDAMLNRKVPGGTLTYSFVETGHGSRTGMGIRHDSFSINHRLSVTAHMHGMVGGTTEQESHQDNTPPQLAGVRKDMDACGDDMACQQRAAMQAMQMSQQQLHDLDTATRENSAKSYRNVTWYGTTCHGNASIDDSDVGNGVDSATEGSPQPVSWNDTTRGASQFDCGNASPGTSDGASSLIADGNSNHYDITLRGSTVQVIDAQNGKPGSRPHEIAFRDFTAIGLKFDSMDKPFTGSRTLHPDKTRTMVVTWMFTPDAK